MGDGLIAVDDCGGPWGGNGDERSTVVDGRSHIRALPTVDDGGGGGEVMTVGMLAGRKAGRDLRSLLMTVESYPDVADSQGQSDYC